MKQINMLFQGKTETFKVTFQGAEYIFCECLTNPAARGFFTNKYVNENTQP